MNCEKKNQQTLICDDFGKMCDFFAKFVFFFELLCVFLKSWKREKIIKKLFHQVEKFIWIKFRMLNNAL